MIRVGFASTVGGCAYYRAELPARSIGLYAPAGLEVDARSSTEICANPDGPAPIGLFLDGDDWIPHVIVLAGGLPMFFGAEGVRAARASGQRVVCDYDDWPWLPKANPHHVEGAHAHKLGAAAAADAVTCSTPPIHDLLARRGIRATLIRNTIDPDRYRDVCAANIGRHVSAAGELVVGYRGLLAGFHDDDVRALGPLPTEGVRYVHVGADPRATASFASIVGLPADLVEERPAVAFEQYGPALVGIDVAVCPLDRRPFSAAKSAIAPLEWHAAGVPWIGSPQREYARLPGALLATRPPAWSMLLESLRDPAARTMVYNTQRIPSEPFGERWARVTLSTIHAAA